jgi:hypothetical protein
VRLHLRRKVRQRSLEGVVGKRRQRAFFALFGLVSYVMGWRDRALDGPDAMEFDIRFGFVLKMQTAFTTRSSPATGKSCLV